MVLLVADQPVVGRSEKLKPTYHTSVSTRIICLICLWLNDSSLTLFALSQLLDHLLRIDSSIEL
jgi:hypothetical protein